VTVDIYILLVAIVTAAVAALVARPRWTIRWAAYVAAPLIAAAVLLILFGGLNPVGPPTLGDLLLIALAVVLMGNQVLGLPELRDWLARRGGPR
jgi:hypothetical protein